MRIRRCDDCSLPEREVSAEQLVLRRRELLGAGLKIGGGLGLGSLLAAASVRAADATAPRAEPDSRYPAPRNDALSVKLPLTDETLASTYNNFYEFGTDKRISGRAQALQTDPWTVEIGGLVERPGKVGLEDLLRRSDLEERVYRFRCVETWAMVIPWTGFPLRALLDRAGPKPEAKYVRFETFHRPSQARYQLLAFWHPWPYTEGLTLAEARNELVLLATGIYGKPLPKQHGAPIRLVVPWKYGFKSIKSIVKIELTATQPQTFWYTIEPKEFDFSANVNPEVPHPRWSQATEKLLGEEERQPTLAYNGYGRWVSELYARG